MIFPVTKCWHLTRNGREFTCHEVLHNKASTKCKYTTYKTLGKKKCKWKGNEMFETCETRKENNPE